MADCAKIGTNFKSINRRKSFTIANERKNGETRSASASVERSISPKFIFPKKLLFPSSPKNFKPLSIKIEPKSLVTCNTLSDSSNGLNFKEQLRNMNCFQLKSAQKNTAQGHRDTPLLPRNPQKAKNTVNGKSILRNRYEEKILLRASMEASKESISEIPARNFSFKSKEEDPGKVPQWDHQDPIKSPTSPSKSILKRSAYGGSRHPGQEPQPLSPLSPSKRVRIREDRFRLF